MTFPEDVAIERLATYGRLGGFDDPEGGGGLEQGNMGTLSNITDAAEARGGNVFVLDRDLRQVIVFHPNGDVLRLIGGGYGEGPGQFSIPTELVLDSGKVFILDIGLNRISWFDTTGVFLNSIQAALPGEARSITVTHDTIWVLSRITRSNSQDVVHGYSLAGQPLFARGDPSPLTVDFAGYGSPGTLAKLSNGEIIYLSGVPIQWSPARRDDWSSSRVGSYIWPDREPVEWRENGVQFRRTPGGTRGLAEFENGNIGILYYEVLQDGPGSDATYLDHFGLFSGSGEPLARGSFPDSIGPLSFIRPGVDGRSILIGSHAPFPRVLRYSVGGFR